MDRRAKILEGLDIARSRGVEIGPLHAPLVANSDGEVIYVDHADAEALRAKYARDPIVGDVSKIVDVDAIWGERSLAERLGERVPVDYVIASHVLEHVPDLISWLQEVRSVLAPTGDGMPASGSSAWRARKRKWAARASQE